MTTKPPPTDLIPQEIRDEPDPAKQLQMLDELAEEVRRFYNELVVAQVVAHGGVGVRNAGLKAAKRLGIPLKKVHNIVYRNPELRPEFSTNPRRRSSSDVTRLE